jgi:hypothetical protein
MRLLQIKLRGLGDLPVTSWVTLSRTLTLLRFTDTQIGRQVLKAVQALNPPYDCLSEQPFGDLPMEEVVASGYRRAIIPEKRTIVIGIFDTPPSLVKDLAALTPPLYETDRVEVGRRLDYSRWINFVEIASSSRWSEVSEDIRKLLDDYPNGSEAQAVQRLLTEAVPSDRIKGAMAEELEAWLTTIENRQSEIAHYPEVLEKVRRARKFTEARELLNGRLPPFLVVNGDDVPAVSELMKANNDPQFSPVLLVDCFDLAPHERTSTTIPEKIEAVAERFQCLCFSDDLHAGWGLPEAQVIDFAELR